MRKLHRNSKQMTVATSHVTMDIDKLKKLPSIDKKTEELLRKLANAIIDRIEDDTKDDK